jgi:hypothetical protein
MLQYLAIDVDLPVSVLLALVRGAHTISIHAQKDTQDQCYRHGKKGNLHTLGHNFLYSPGQKLQLILLDGVQ